MHDIHIDNMHIIGAYIKCYYYAVSDLTPFGPSVRRRADPPNGVIAGLRVTLREIIRQAQSRQFLSIIRRIEQKEFFGKSTQIGYI